MDHGLHVQTYTGKMLDLEKFSVKDVDILDIAHSLSLTNRYMGHSSKPVPVARHAVCVARYLEELGHKDYAYEGLHHDDAEAYVGDMNKWMKHHPTMEFYRDLERNIHTVIMRVFHVEPITYTSSIVQDIDRHILRFEVTMFYENWQAPTVGYAKMPKDEFERVYEMINYKWIHSMDPEHLYLREHLRLGRDTHGPRRHN